jgi:hypothetical protein
MLKPTTALDSIQKIVINKPDTQRPEIPVFPMSSTEQRRILPMDVKRCQFCNPRMRSHMHQLREWMYDGKSPSFILTNLKRKGVCPIDSRTNDFVQSAQRFDELLGMHMIHCTRESHVSYTNHWRITTEAATAAIELRERMSELTGFSSDNEILDYETHQGTNNAPPVDPLAAEGLSLEEMMSEILITQIKAVLIEHRKYMQKVSRGEDCTPPSMSQFNSTLVSFTKLFGSFKVGELLEEIPGAASAVSIIRDMAETEATENEAA